MSHPIVCQREHWKRGGHKHECKKFKAIGSYRFEIGQRVKCFTKHMSQICRLDPDYDWSVVVEHYKKQGIDVTNHDTNQDTPTFWEAGKIFEYGFVTQRYYRDCQWVPGKGRCCGGAQCDHPVVPYQVQLDRGQLIMAKMDTDEIIRKVEEEDPSTLRFPLGTRVQCNYFHDVDRCEARDLCDWPHGVVIEHFYRGGPEKDGVCCYFVRLDSGKKIWAQFDWDEAIRIHEPEDLQRKIAVLRYMHLIEDACEDYSKGIRHAVCEVIDTCWETIKDRQDGETWLGHLSCNAVSDESKLELITTLAKLRVSKLQQQDVETANAKMKENNGGVYFKKK